MAKTIQGFDPNGSFYEERHPDHAQSRTPLVLIHGVGLDHEMWEWQMPLLSERYVTIRYDLLGHGRTTNPTPAERLQDFVEQLCALLDYLELDVVHLAGFSLGALIAQCFCRDNAHRLASICFLNGVYKRLDSELVQVKKRLELTREQGAGATVGMALERWFSPGYRTAHPEVMAQISQRLMDNDLDGYVRAYDCFVHGDPEVGDALSSVSCPALVMTAQNDVGSTPAMSERIAADIRDARVVVLPVLAHGAPIEGASEMATEILQFLDTAESQLATT